MQTNFNPLTYGTLCSESSTDTLLIGDSSCSFIGSLKLFEVYQGNSNVIPSTILSDYFHFNDGTCDKKVRARVDVH